MGVRLGRPPGSSSKKVSFCKHIDEALALKAEGKSIKEIAIRYDIHRNTLTRYLKEMEKKSSSE